VRVQNMQPNCQYTLAFENLREKFTPVLSRNTNVSTTWGTYEYMCKIQIYMVPRECGKFFISAIPTTCVPCVFQLPKISTWVWIIVWAFEWLYTPPWTTR